MRKLLITFLFAVICALPLAAQIPLLPTNQRISSNNVQTCAFPKNVTSGNIVIVGASTEGTLTGISDTRSTSYTNVNSSTANSITTRVWVGTLSSGGANTVTVTGTASFNNIHCLEVPASAWTATVDVSTNGGYTGTPATVTTASVTTTKNGDLYYVYLSGFQSGGVMYPQSPLLNLGNGGGTDSAVSAYMVTGTNGAYTSTINNVTNTKGNYVVITLKPAAVNIQTTALPTGSLSNAYSYTLQALGGAGAYTWSITSGSLFTGLSLNSSTGAITGTPTAGGTNSITFQVSDGTNSATATLNLTVNSSAGTPAYIQGAQNTTGTPSITFGSNVASGNCGVVGKYTYDANTAQWANPTDSVGTVYQYLGAVQSPNQRMAMALYAGVFPSSGSNTITTSLSTATIAAEFSNCQVFNDALSIASGKSSASATLTSGSLTTGVPNSMMYCAVAAFTGPTTLTAQSPFTSDGNSTSNGPARGEYDLKSSTGSYTATFTQASNTDGDWALTCTALRPGTSGTVANAVRHRSQIY